MTSTVVPFYDSKSSHVSHLRINLRDRDDYHSLYQHFCWRLLNIANKNVLPKTLAEVNKIMNKITKMVKI